MWAFKIQSSILIHKEVNSRRYEKYSVSASPRAGRLTKIYVVVNAVGAISSLAAFSVSPELYKGQKADISLAGESLSIEDIEPT